VEDRKDSCLLDGDDEICGTFNKEAKDSLGASPLRIIRAIQRISLGVARRNNWAKIRFELSLLMLVVDVSVKIGLTTLILILKARPVTRSAGQSGACLPLRSISLIRLPTVSMGNLQQFPSKS